MDFLTTKWLMGHNIDDTNSAYFKADPEAVKEDYIKIMDQLVTDRVEIKVINTNEAMANEIEELKNEIIHINSKINPEIGENAILNPNVRFVNEPEDI